MKRTHLLFLLIPLFLTACDDGVRTEPDPNLAFGIDVSQYQGKINWSKVGDRHPVEFVFLRISMGKDGIDSRAKHNLKGAKKEGFKIGVYHYYRPDENSTQQASHFLQQLKSLNPDLDFRVVLDIEEEPAVQTMAQLKVGLEKWLDQVEGELDHKPIIYSSLNYYDEHLKGDAKFKDYPIWIASYNSRRRKTVRKRFNFHQFTDEVRIAGISGYTDGNDIVRSKLSEYLHPDKAPFEQGAEPLLVMDTAQKGSIQGRNTIGSDTTSTESVRSQ